MKFRYIPANDRYMHSFDAVSVTDDTFFEALEWCAQMFGRQDDLEAVRWVAGNFRIIITHDDDAFAFRMRWC